MASSGLLRRVALVRADVLEELIASFIRVTRIGELVSLKYRFLKEPHCVTIQKTPFFIITAVKTPQILHNINCLDSVADVMCLL
jgi:uncharacterized membrane protein